MSTDFGTDVRQRTLSNGLEVYVWPMPQARTAAFSLVVRVGSRHEDEASHGASHLLEHMFFRGTPRFPSAHALNAAVERIGSTLDASTSRDRTNFEMRTFPETLPEALALTGEILTEASFADLELERRVVLQERLDEVDASGRDVDLDNIAKAALWPIGGLGRKIIGTKRSIQGLDVPALRAHRDRYYVGRNMVLGVAGPLEPEAVWEAAERAFHGLPPGERSVIEPAGARTDLPACELVSHSGSQTDFELCFLGPPDGHPDTLALSMLLRVLDDGTASRLRVRLCDELGLAYDVGARLEVFEDTGLVGVAGAVAHAQIAEVLEETCRLLGKLQREPVSEEELNRARARVRLDLLSTLDSVESCATYLASAAANRNPEPLRDRMRRALAFDADDLRAVARRHFRPSAAQIALVGDVPRKLKRRIVSALDALDPDPG